MEENVKIERFVSHVKEYAEERLNLIILNLTLKVSKVLSKAAGMVTFSIIGIFALLFVSIGVAWWIGTMLQQPFLGFLIMGGIYLLIVILLYANREKWIHTPVINAFLKNISDEEN